MLCAWVFFRERSCTIMYPFIAAVNRAVGVTRRKPDLAPAVLPLATEAAWRLCKWDSLDALLKQDTSSRGFALRDKDWGLDDVPDIDEAAPAGEACGTSSYIMSLARSVSELRMTSRQRPAAATLAMSLRPSTLAGCLDPSLSVSRVSLDVQTLLVALSEGAPYAGIVDAGGKKSAQEAAVALGNAASLFSALTPAPMLLLRESKETNQSAQTPRAFSGVARLQPPGFRTSFDSSIAEARAGVMASLAASSMESYTRAYPSLVRLHCLRELERAAADLTHIPDTASRDNCVGQWDLEARLSLTSPSAAVREAILAPRHALFRIFDLRDREAGVWVDVARLARSSGNHVAASAALLRASALGSDVASVHAAKLLYLQGHVHRALQQLEPVERDVEAVIERLKAACDAAAGQSEDRVQAAQRQCALEAKRTLYATRWMVESRLIPESVAEVRFKGVCRLYPTWEKAWFSLGKFYDAQLKGSAKVYSDSTLKDPSTAERRDAQVLGVVEAYCKALVHGHGHIFEVLPRVLTLMFDYGAACSSAATYATATTADARETAEVAFYALVARTGMMMPQEKTLDQIVRTIKEMRVSGGWEGLVANMEAGNTCFRFLVSHAGRELFPEEFLDEMPRALIPPPFAEDGGLSLDDSASSAHVSRVPSSQTR